MRYVGWFCSLILLGAVGVASAQSLYFPPAGSSWAQIDPVKDLSWCADKLDSLQHFLDEKDTKAFLILKDGRMAVEWYFGNFTRDSLWYWASAGKSLTATLVGLAQQEGILDIEQPSADFLGQGWSQCSAEEEAQITIRHHLSMATGLDDGLGDSDCTDPECLSCLAQPGSRWAYHNAPYTLLESVISNAAGQGINVFYTTRLGSKIGAGGFYLPIGYNRVFFSKARDMARFGLLIQAGGHWNGQPILSDSLYYQAMIQPSQPMNPSYGYLWWLNGQGAYMVPGLQIKLPGDLIPQAPADLIAALGKDDQKLYVVPSQGWVVVRLGQSAGGFSPALSGFDQQLWQRIMDLPCTVALDPVAAASQPWVVAPNPAITGWQLEGPPAEPAWQLFGLAGNAVGAGSGRWISAAGLPPGIYLLRVQSGSARLVWLRLVRQ